MIPELAHLPRFGRYEPVFRIAAGGMAEVYGARAVGEAGFRRWVALKRMLPHLSDDPIFVGMFLDEARIAANIAHPNVVSTLDLGRSDDGSAYLVMDLVVGSTLSAMFRSAARRGERIPMAVALEVLAQAAAGLHAAHEATSPEGEPLQIVHRDVSPQNILVGVNGRAQIMDFGVARAAMRESRTRTGEVKGKLSYFSPEQAAADEIDRRSDVFSLATVGWEVLAGKRLFHAENPLNILRKLTQEPIPRLDEIDPAVPATIADVIARALERALDARTPSCARFAEELRGAMREAQVYCSEAEVGRAARELGSPTVERIESAVRRAAELDDTSEAAPSPEVSEVSQTRKTHGRPSSMEEAPSEPEPEPEVSVATVVSKPAHELRSSGPRLTLALGALGALLVLAALVAVVLGGRGAGDATPPGGPAAASVDAPAASATAGAADEPDAPGAGDEVPAAEHAPLLVPPADDAPDDAPDGAPDDAMEEAASVEAPLPAAEQAPARRGRRGRRGAPRPALGRGTRPEAPSPNESAAPPRPDESAAPPPSRRPAPTRGLRGVDAFERDLGAGRRPPG
jgi:serine/threonine protein kinase